MIQFHTDLLRSNPAYNDSIIRYSSTTTGMTKSEILIAGVTPIVVYPYNEIFSYNFKDVAKNLINLNGFRDSILPDLQTCFIHSDPSLALTINPIIKVYNSLSAETTVATYSFTKSVEQLPFYNKKIQSQNDVKVLLPTSDNFNYHVTYTEGYPFDFAIRGLKSGDTYFFKNANAGMVSETYTSNDNDVKRIYLSDGATNETLDQTLIMMTAVNPIELWVNGEVKANINIKRVESKCGVLLKWFNQYGSYSYWVFDQFYKESSRTKDLDVIAGRWDNLQNLTSTSESLGKTLNKSLELSTSFNSTELEYLSDIIKSPKVEMYINEEPFIKVDDYSFLGVLLNDSSFPFDNKWTNRKLKVTIELPEYNTITY